MSEAASALSSGNRLTPTLAVRRIVRPSTTTGSAAAARIFAAKVAAKRPSSRSSITITNSSPPSRATVSISRVR